MKTTLLMKMSLGALLLGVMMAGCKKKSLDEVDISYHHSPEGVHEKIQEQKLILGQAFKNGEFVFIHDQAYYVQGLVDALAAKLEGDRKQRLDPVFKEISRLLDEIHDTAGKRNAAITEAKLEQLYVALKQLEPEFPSPKKKK